MTVNVPLLRKTLEHIEAHPEEWNQRTWRCGTAMCFAGRAAEISGAQWCAASPNEPFVLAEEDDNRDGLVHVEDRARRLLGLSYEDSTQLFWSQNTLDDLRRIVAELSEDGAS